MLFRSRLIIVCCVTTGNQVVRGQQHCSPGHVEACRCFSGPPGYALPFPWELCRGNMTCFDQIIGLCLGKGCGGLVIVLRGRE